MIATDRLAEAARRADYLINMLPASENNIGIFDAKIFGAMKPSAYYISAGRGQTVDEAALLAVLRERRIAGAALEVFQTEPLPADSPFWDLPNVFITPHIGGYVIEYEDFIMPLIVDNMRLFLAGRQSEMQQYRRAVSALGAHFAACRLESFQSDGIIAKSALRAARDYYGDMPRAERARAPWREMRRTRWRSPSSNSRSSCSARRNSSNMRRRRHPKFKARVKEHNLVAQIMTRDEEIGRWYAFNDGVDHDRRRPARKARHQADVQERQDRRRRC